MLIVIAVLLTIVFVRPLLSVDVSTSLRVRSAGCHIHYDKRTALVSARNMFNCAKLQ